MKEIKGQFTPVYINPRKLFNIKFCNMEKIKIDKAEQTIKDMILSPHFFALQVMPDEERYRILGASPRKEYDLQYSYFDSIGAVMHTNINYNDSKFDDTIREITRDLILTYKQGETVGEYILMEV